MSSHIHALPKKHWTNPHTEQRVSLGQNVLFQECVNRFRKHTLEVCWKHWCQQNTCFGETLGLSLSGPQAKRKRAMRLYWHCGDPKGWMRNAVPTFVPLPLLNHKNIKLLFIPMSLSPTILHESTAPTAAQGEISNTGLGVGVWHSDSPTA